MKLVDLLAKVVPHSWALEPMTPDGKPLAMPPTVARTREHHAELAEPEAE